ncbi:2385_t:CDS:2, partial [Gigaspora margarita]
MSSELELLKQRIIELEAENAELRRENIEIPNLRKKILEFYSKRAELMCIMAKTLKMTKEERARRGKIDSFGSITIISPGGGGAIINLRGSSIIGLGG